MPSVRANWPRNDSGRNRVIPARALSSHWPSASVPARGRPPPRRLPASRRAPAHGGSGRSEPQPSPGTPGPPNSSRPRPAAPSAGGEPASEAAALPSGPRPASRSGPEHDTCGRYSGYSEDTTADNVSSPGPRTRRGYSKDSQNGARDNGGYLRGYAKTEITTRDGLRRRLCPQLAEAEATGCRLAHTAKVLQARDARPCWRQMSTARYGQTAHIMRASTAPVFRRPAASSDFEHNTPYD